MNIWKLYKLSAARPWNFARVKHLRVRTRSADVWVSAGFAGSFSLTSSQSCPIDLRAGEHREVNLGGKGVTTAGRVDADAKRDRRTTCRCDVNRRFKRRPGSKRGKTDGGGEAVVLGTT